MWILAGIAKTTFRWSFLDPKQRYSHSQHSPTAKSLKPYCQIFKTFLQWLEFSIFVVVIVRLLIPLIALLADATSQKLQVERLPDMSVPRSFPTMAVSPDGSICALGGYTTGFVPLSSAEIFRDGKWRALPPMSYPHAGAFSVTLEDGRVMVGGGSAEAFGIGQTFGVEMFNPVLETFDPLGIMPGRRVLSSAVMLKDSTVVVSGNWYASDNIVLYTTDGEFSIFKPVTEERSAPLLFPTEDGDVLVFGGTDTRGEYLSGWVDCLKGDSFKPELFEEYLPYVPRPASSNEYALGGGSYLFPVMRRSDGQIAIARVQGKEFSLLPTDEPISMALPDGAQIYWDRLLVDRARRKAYMTGLSEGHGCAVLVVDYDQALDGGEAKLSLLFAPEEDGPFPYESRSILLRPGQIALVGGRMEDNFHPVSSAYILHLDDFEDVPARNGFPWPWLLGSGFLAGLVLVLVVRRGKSAPALAESPRVDLLSRIVALMEEGRLYLRKDLRLSDVAAELGTNATYVSACLNGQLGRSFSDFVASFRVEHAKRLLQEHPDMPLDQVADESGFLSERSFFRNFKLITGKTPSEWRLG